MRCASVQDASRGRRIGAASAEFDAEQARLAAGRAGRARSRHGRGSSRPRRRPPARSGLMRVERAGAGEAFELAAVEQPRVDARGEILEAGERPAPLALLDQRLHRLLADALERAERIADRAVLDGEMRVAGVDVGRQALDPAAAHVLDEHRRACRSAPCRSSSRRRRIRRGDAPSARRSGRRPARRPAAWLLLKP